MFYCASCASECARIPSSLCFDVALPCFFSFRREMMGVFFFFMRGVRSVSFVSIPASVSCPCLLSSCFFFVALLRSFCALSPQGLRAYLRAAIQYTYSKAVCPYVVHELSDVPYLHGDFFQQPEPFNVNIARDSR